MTFTLPGVITYCMLSFAIALYVGAFVQHRRDIEAFRIEKRINEYKRKLSKELVECEENQNAEETEICNV